MEDEKNIHVILKCIYCGKTFPDLSSFRNHVTEEIIKPHRNSGYFKMYYCMICKNWKPPGSRKNMNFHKSSCEISLKLKMKMTDTKVSKERQR